MPTQRILDYGNKIALTTPSRAIARNYFNMDGQHKYSTNWGKLVPVYWKETLPGDDWELTPEALMRIQPMLAPPMQRFTIRWEAFQVSYRNLWPNAPSFFGNPREGVTPPAAPYFSTSDMDLYGFGYIGTLANHLGMPSKGRSGVIDPTSFPDANAFPFAAYTKINCDHYIDEDIEPDTKVFPMLVDGSNDPSLYSQLFSRHYEKDYFTSCKPWAQKGPDVVIPSLVGNLPVTYFNPGNLPGKVQNVDAVNAIAANTAIGTDAAAPPLGSSDLNSIGSSVNAAYDPNGTLVISPTDYVGAAGTIEELARARAIQAFLTADAIGGGEYYEVIETQYGVHVSDLTLQRSMYLGGGTQPVSISEVLNMTGTADAPQGTMAGHGISLKHHGSVRCRCEEWGIVMILASVTFDTDYFEGIPQGLLRSARLDRYSYPWPLLAELGNQPVPNKEVFWDSTADPAVMDAPFGYLPIYSYWKMAVNQISGDFVDQLDFWGLWRKFSELPGLDQRFIQISQVTPADNEDLMRIFAVDDPTVDHLLLHWFVKATVHRALPRSVRPMF